MDKKRIIKLRTSQGLAKRIDFPKTFDELIEKTKTFLNIDEHTKKYQFMDEKVNREIRHQEDFELMSKAYEEEKTVKILVNVVDKEETLLEEIPISHVYSNNKLNEESINISITPNPENNKKNEDEPEDNIKKDIQELVKSKMKDLENNIIQDIYKSIKTQLNINEEKINNLNLNQQDRIHNNIICNNCGKENIKGIRYKCAQCPNFDLCDNCEKFCQHDVNHIFIKIRKPLKEESELLFKMKKDLKYKNTDYNYSVNIKDIKFTLDKKENDVLIQQITLKNIGNEPWKAGAVFKCLPDSQIKGKDFKIECKLNKDATNNIELIFDNAKDQIMPSVNEYFIYYQMFNSNNEAFGNITKFRVIFQN